jgi:hypothetical protein
MNNSLVNNRSGKIRQLAVLHKNASKTSGKEDQIAIILIVLTRRLAVWFNLESSLSAGKSPLNQCLFLIYSMIYDTLTENPPPPKPWKRADHSDQASTNRRNRLIGKRGSDIVDKSVFYALNNLWVFLPQRNTYLCPSIMRHNNIIANPHRFTQSIPNVRPSQYGSQRSSALTAAAVQVIQVVKYDTNLKYLQRMTEGWCLVRTGM